MKLQCNAKGAWRDVIEFSDADRQRVVEAVAVLIEAAPDIGWCLLDDAGKREWLEVAHAAS